MVGERPIVAVEIGNADSDLLAQLHQCVEPSGVSSDSSNRRSSAPLRKWLRERFRFLFPGLDHRMCLKAGVLSNELRDQISVFFASLLLLFQPFLGVAIDDKKLLSFLS